MFRHFDEKHNFSSTSSFWGLEHANSLDLLPFPRDVFRSSMNGNNHGSWNGKWPENLTNSGAKFQDEVLSDRREMFSPFGRGRPYTKDSSNSQVKRSSSAPPRTTKTLRESVRDSGVNINSGKDATDRFKTPSGANLSVDNSHYLGMDISISSEMANQSNAQINKSVNIKQAPTRDISAAIAKWSSKSLAELMTSKFGSESSTNA